MKSITIICVLICVLTTAIDADRTLRKHRAHRAQHHNRIASHAHSHSHSHSHVKGTPRCRAYNDEDRDRHDDNDHAPTGSGFRICQYVDDYQLKICTEETEWSATALSLSTPLRCTLGNRPNEVVFTVWVGTYERIKIVGARDVQGPSLYPKSTWSWRAGTATDCVGFFLGVHWKTTAWTSENDYTAYATRITGCYITSEINDKAKEAAIAIFSSILGACGPVGDVLNIIFTMATTIPGVLDPKNNDIIHALAVCEIGTILHERCHTVITGYSYLQPQTVECRARTVETRVATGEYSFKGVACANHGEMNGDLFLKFYAGTCAESSDSTKRLTTTTGLLERLCDDGGAGFDYQLPDWDEGRTFDPSGGMCVAMYDSDWGNDDFLCHIEVRPVLSEGSMEFNCQWDSDTVHFTLTYELVPRR